MTSIDSHHVRASGLHFFRISGLSLFGLLGALPAHAAVYKCTDANGQIAYLDRPCMATARQQEIHIQPAPRPPAAAPADAASPAAKPASANVDDTNRDCTSWIPPPWSVKVDPPAKPDLSGLRRDEQGRAVITSSANLKLVAVEKPDALSVQSACSTMLTTCWHKDNDKKNSMDACFQSAPRCTTSRPWEEGRACCPQSCWQRYSTLRRQCADPLGAVQ
ncbi:MAG: DUF4124 domain-containing protein, partial [Rudaea sp.]